MRTARGPSRCRARAAIGGSRALDYIEEPLAHPTTKELARLRKAAGVAVGVDESFELLGGIEALVASGA
jgi:L-alanine-DL-glutamate epimerase-like enolase superfamily enzyme